MASESLNVLVYSGPGSTPESVRHCLYSLRRLLSPNYAVYPVSSDIILTQPWSATCALLAMPGGADLGYCRLLNGEGNRRIRQFVTTGGAYIGFCAGGYYGSSRCEFEVGDEKMEVVGDRELKFYPGTCRGAAFAGFKYNSELGARAVELNVEKSSFPSSGGVLPTVFRAYSNGGSVFADAPKYVKDGVQVLASYTGKLDVDPGEGSAAVVYCKVGEGCALLTGPHPEFAATNLSRTARGMDSAVVDALLEDDKQRYDFLKACLLKIGLRVNLEAQDVPSLSPIYFSSSEADEVSNIMKVMRGSARTETDGQLFKGEHDTFRLASPSSTLSLKDLAVALSEVSDGDRQKEDPVPNDKIPDYDNVTKQIVAYEQGIPSSKETPYFSHQSYFDSLATYTNSARSSHGPQLGHNLLYGEVVTSTSTLLEKNPSLTTHLPTGTTITATSQLSGRGRGTNVWVSPPGSLMFSFVLRHPLSLSVTAPVVFIQYLAALAIAEAVGTYAEGSGHHPDSSNATKSNAYATVPVKLKWPNDIYALDPKKTSSGASPSDRTSYVKIGGILVNSSYSGGDFTLIVGIGLNVSNAAPTTSLNAVVEALNASARGKTQLAPYTPERLLARILTSFRGLYGEFCVHGFGGRLEALYYEYWLHGGQEVVLETEGGARARIKGVTTDWGLLRAEELVEDGRGGVRGTGREFALQTDSNSFDFFKGLIKRKI